MRKSFTSIKLPCLRSEALACQVWTANALESGSSLLISDALDPAVWIHVQQLLVKSCLNVPHLHESASNPVLAIPLNAICILTPPHTLSAHSSTSVA